MRLHRVAALLLVLLVPATSRATGPDPAAELSRVNDLVEGAQIEEAASRLAPLEVRFGDEPPVAFASALVAFERGDYARAVERADFALAHVPRDHDMASWRTMRELMASSRDVTRGYAEARSADGRFVVRYPPGIDRVLAPYALVAMRAASDAMAEDLGYRPPGVVRLEVYPDPSALSRVSTLTVEEIERTGTIALCKWDRLMVTSPRALVRGYPWLDTIAHEYTHLVLTRLTHDRAPVWMQEGIAKMLERRWRAKLSGRPADGEGRLEPAAQAMLDRAVRRGTLIPFDRLHPSIARLPSQDAAALAFAQVFSFLRFFTESHGFAGLRAVLGHVRDGEDARAAMGRGAGTSFDALQEAWQRLLQAGSPATSPTGPAPHLLGLRFRRGSGRVDESSDVSVETARRFLRLGDLLWERHRAAAAAVEYRQAHEAAPQDPIVAARYGRAAVASGNPTGAIEALSGLRVLYPDYAPGWAVLGAAYLRAGQRATAIEALVEAIRLNPFDPGPHCDLVDVAPAGADVERERDLCRALGGA